MVKGRAGPIDRELDVGAKVNGDLYGAGEYEGASMKDTGDAKDNIGTSSKVGLA
jgi:hypothetical protein